MTDWISVKDRLPEPGEYILVYCPTRKYAPVWLGWYWEDFFYLFEQDDDDVTHWMPMPKPPQEATND